MFWSEDQRFLSQFKAGDFKSGGVCKKFKTYSKYPPCLKDVSFWLPESLAGVNSFTENNLCEVVRGAGGDLVEEANIKRAFEV